MEPIPLNVVRAAVADAPTDTAGIAVVAPVADITGAAADARATLAGAAADTAVVAGDARAALADATAVCVCRTMFVCMALTTGQGCQSCSWSAAEPA